MSSMRYGYFTKDMATAGQRKADETKGHESVTDQIFLDLFTALFANAKTPPRCHQ